MITKQDPAATGVGTGLAILVLGVLIGFFARPDTWSSPPDSEEAARQDVGHLHRNLKVPSDPQAPPDNGLATLSVDIGPDESRVLQSVVERALARGMIVQSPEDTVPARVDLDGKAVPAEVRIKGDWLDHVNTNKWSLRVRLDGDKLLGMSVFSIQAPQTRGMLWEWLVLETMRHEGVLAPRATFVNVVLNGNPVGVFYLEEHFSKELLESQGRREGPIVLWDESNFWATMLQHHNLPEKDVTLPVPSTAHEAYSANRAEVRAYGEKRLASIDSLSRSLFSAVEKMERLKDLALSADSQVGRLRRLEALEATHAQVLEDLVAVDSLARAHAVASLFQVEHALIWHNMRFYHDPVLNRLEPIMFDHMADRPGGRDPVLFRGHALLQEFGRSRAYYDELFRALGRLCAPTYLDDLFADLRPDLERFEAALDAERPLHERFHIDSMLQRLRTEQTYLRNVLFPLDPIHFSNTYRFEESSETPVAGTLEVHAWSTSRTPVVLDGFRYENGSFLRARPYLVEEGSRVSFDGEGGVVLPYDGRPVAFRFPMNARLANLENVQQIKQAARLQQRADEGLDFEVSAVFRPIATSSTSEELLLFRRLDPRWQDERGRPPALSLQETVAAHPFLEYDFESGRLRSRAGQWDVEGDLIVPPGVPLELRAGTRLRFEPDAVLLSESRLLFRGTQASPVVLAPREGADHWRGVVVLGAEERSLWEHVTILQTDAVARAGWVVTGGITFYHSPITMRDCHIAGTLAEDGTNIFGTDFLLERVTFSECVSDSFDGDFVTGTVRDCTFRDGLADGVDFSGSDVDVVDCRFLNMGDKAVSAGENSVVRVRGGIAEGVSIGIAAKDRSQVDVHDMKIHGARNYALAVFVKKPEYGPATLRASGLEIRDAGLGTSIVQTGCTLILDGVEAPTQALDVEQLYKEKILGQ